MTSTLARLPRLHAPTLHHLPNGLTIIAEQMPIDAVNLDLWVKTGSAMEADAINGMAHFLEHIVFKGTQKLISGEFERRIEERGAVTNAATSQDYTHYYITTAPKDFAELAPLQIDIVCNPTIPDHAFERERLVVLEEIRRSEDNPGRRIYRQIMETAFDTLPYRRPVLGPAAVISQVKPQQMRDFHTHWYQPQSITAVAVGNLPVEELIEIIATEFNQNYQQITNKPTETPVIPEPAFTEIVRQEVIDKTLQQARLVMIWRVPGLKELNQTYALDIIAGILGHGRTSRLVHDLQEEQQLVSSISVNNMSNLWQGVFSISAKCHVENLAAVEKAIAQHLHRLQTELVKESEIARVQQRIANRFIFGNETPSDRAGLYGYYQSLIGDLEPAFNYPQLMYAQQATDLIQAAKNYLSPNAYGIVIVKPI
ncbi:pitrilysin family protein [Dolichospermum planctonicum CS-1226]|uniref:Pitrilysin family protein n=1 Tax=Dolichospermum planctonicum CS-1226 TaxID=3021751 RepID=A0ABT5AMB7_9CYAN|nr:pitrilysin family protein [Dolichospermum planctonicum]MDB9537868.1 pitrilysin family protein [Dolichospermum planctonicum CS-1226]